MKTLLTLCALAAVALAFPQQLSPRQSSPNPPLSTNQAQALYFMSNNPSGNVLHAVPVAADGSLSMGQGRQYSTGGNGGRAQVSSGTPTAVGLDSLDALYSQGSVTVAGTKIYVVNPGSNTLSLFNISCDDPTILHQIGPPVNTLGDFPTAVGASSVLDTACVANTGTNSGVACFGLELGGLVPLDRAQRPLTLPFTQTNPPTGPAGTISQVLFNNDLSELLVVSKGDNNGNGGFLASYPVTNSGQVGTTATMNRPDDSYVMCGTVALPNGNLGIVDAVVGGLLVQKNSPGHYNTISNVSSQGIYYRWASQSPLSNYIFTTPSTPYLAAAVDATNGQYTVHHFGGNAANAGETVAAGQFLYTLSYGTASAGQYILVAKDPGNNGDLTDVQQFAISGVDRNVVGLAAFIPGEVDQQCAPETPA